MSWRPARPPGLLTEGGSQPRLEIQQRTPETRVFEAAETRDEQRGREETHNLGRVLEGSYLSYDKERGFTT